LVGEWVYRVCSSTTKEEGRRLDLERFVRSREILLSLSLLSLPPLLLLLVLLSVSVGSSKRGDRSSRKSRSRSGRNDEPPRRETSRLSGRSSRLPQQSSVVGRDVAGRSVSVGDDGTGSVSVGVVAVGKKRIRRVRGSSRDVSRRERVSEESVLKRRSAARLLRTSRRSLRSSNSLSRSSTDGSVSVSKVSAGSLGDDGSRGVSSDGGTVEVREVGHGGLVSEGGRRRRVEVLVLGLSVLEERVGVVGGEVGSRGVVAESLLERRRRRGERSARCFPFVSFSTI